MTNILANDIIKELEEDFPVFVQVIETREMYAEETEIKEEEQPPMEPMHAMHGNWCSAPFTVELAKMFSPIEELVNNFGLQTT